MVAMPCRAKSLSGGTRGGADTTTRTTGKGSGGSSIDTNEMAGGGSGQPPHEPPTGTTPPDDSGEGKPMSNRNSTGSVREEWWQAMIKSIYSWYTKRSWYMIFTTITSILGCVKLVEPFLEDKFKVQALGTQVTNVEKTLSTKITTTETTLNQTMSSLDTKLGSLDTKLDGVVKDLKEHVDLKVAPISQQLNRLAAGHDTLKAICSGLVGGSTVAAVAIILYVVSKGKEK